MTRDGRSRALSGLVGAVVLLVIGAAGPVWAGPWVDRSAWLNQLGGGVQCFDFDSLMEEPLSFGPNQVGPIVVTLLPLDGQEVGKNYVLDFSGSCGGNDYCVNGTLQLAHELAEFDQFVDVDTVLIQFPTEVLAFGADWASIASSGDGIAVGFEDGPTVLEYHLINYLGGSEAVEGTVQGSGFFGVLETVPFSTIRIFLVDDYELFGLDDICWGSPDPAEITVSGPSSALVGEAAEFTASWENCNPSSINWEWTASDDGTVMGTGSTVEVSWPTPGTKTVTATNSACDGAVGEATISVFPEDVPPPIEGDPSEQLSQTGSEIQVATNPFGGWTAVWVESATSTTSLHRTAGPAIRAPDSGTLFAQFFDKDDVPHGPPFEVGGTPDLPASDPSISTETDGTTAIGFGRETEDGDRIRVKFFDETGEQDGGGVTVDGPPSLATETTTAVSPNGEFVTVWTRTDATETTSSVFVRFFDKNRNPTSAPIVVGGGSEASSPDVSMSGNGNAVVVWVETGVSESGDSLFAAMFDKTGNTVQPPFVVDGSVAGADAVPAVSTNADGEGVVVWASDSGGGDGLDIQGQQLAPSGAKKGGVFTVNASTVADQVEPSVATNSSGEFLVAWQNQAGGTTESTSSSVFARFFDKSGNPIGTEFEVAAPDDGNSAVDPDVAIADDDSMHVTYGEEDAEGEPAGVYSRTFRVINECLSTIGVNDERTDQLTNECESANRANRFARYFQLTITTTTDVIIDLASDDFDPYLFVLEGTGPEGDVIAEDNNSGAGPGAHLELQLGPGIYTLEATSFAAGSSGTFTLTLDEPGVPEAPPGPWMTTTSIPGFGFKARITTPQGEVQSVQQESLCIGETLCASGAVVGRSEVFMRVVGPKPNGKLWPTLVKFTTSEVEIWIEQDETGQQQYYVLEGARPGFDELPGLFDRQGFSPIAPARARWSEPDSSLVTRMDPPPGEWMVTSEMPGFETKVRITNTNGTEISTQPEAGCIEETLCVSGALAGRSEVFVRVIGPRPNGKLWPTLVKFSTSRVEVWIRQTSTGQVNYYDLPAAAPGQDDLTGLFDREGFDP